MERLLAQLERRFGRYAVPNLMLFIVGGTALVWALSLSKPGFPDHLGLDWHAARSGEPWRLVTFLFIPPPLKGMWLLFWFYFTWWVGSSLEQQWGAFKFNLYVLTEVVTLIVASMVAGPIHSSWLGGSRAGSLFLAFATVFPDTEIYIFFILPLRAKWLGLVGAAMLGLVFSTGGFSTRAGILAQAATYALFFGEHWISVARGQRVVLRQQSRRASMQSSAPPSLGERACAVCGAKEADGADIRVCTCEKCGGKPRSLCLAHARNH